MKHQNKSEPKDQYQIHLRKHKPQSSTTKPSVCCFAELKTYKSVSQGSHTSTFTGQIKTNEMVREIGVYVTEEVEIIATLKSTSYNW